MPSNLRYLGLDVHAETIAVAVAEPDGEVHPLGIIPNRSSTITHYAGLCHPLPTLSTRTDFAIVHDSPRCSGETKGKPGGESAPVQRSRCPLMADTIHQATPSGGGSTTAVSAMVSEPAPS